MRFSVGEEGLSQEAHCPPREVVSSAASLNVADGFGRLLPSAIV